MSDLFPVPDSLRQAEYAQLIFQLEAREYFDLPAFGLLRLRREFRLAIRSLQEEGDAELAEQLRQLLEPPLPEDTKLRKLVQKPAPPFVLRPELQRSGLVEPGDWLELPVLFLGSGIQSIEAFTRMLQQVCRQGLFHGQGRCELATIEVEDGSGRRTTLWNRGPFEGNLMPLVNALDWWLERQPAAWQSLALEFVSPARLIHNGKPLFRADFGELFPFIVRRVSALLAAHCYLDPVRDPAQLIGLADQVEVVENRLHWRDWKTLQGGREGQEIGGLCGSLVLAGNALADLLWVLQLGALFQVGKGAPYGAGRFDIAR